MAGVNQLERDLIRMRQQEGKFKGRLKKYTTNHSGLRHAFTLYDEEEMTVKKICEITHISKSTFYRELKRRENNHS